MVNVIVATAIVGGLMYLGVVLRKQQEQAGKETESIVQNFQHPGFVVTYAKDVATAVRFAKWHSEKPGSRELKYYLYETDVFTPKGYRNPTEFVFIAGWNDGRPYSEVDELMEALHFSDCDVSQYAELPGGGFVELEFA